MNPVAKILLPLVLLAGVGGVAWYLNTGETALPPAPQQPEAVKPPLVEQPTVQPATPVKPPEPDNQRTVVAVPTESRTDAAQGVRGHVLLPNGAPAAGVPVYLMQAVTADPLNIFLASKTGQKFPPVASGHTAEDGTFALGVTRPKDTYDLRIVSDEYPELQHRSIKVREEDWYDTGALRFCAAASTLSDRPAKTGVRFTTVPSPVSSASTPRRSSANSPRRLVSRRSSAR